MRIQAEDLNQWILHECYDGFCLGGHELGILDKIYVQLLKKNETITIQTKLNWSTTVSHYKVAYIFSKKKVDMVYIGLKSKGAFTYKW